MLTFNAIKWSKSSTNFLPLAFRVYAKMTFQYNKIIWPIIWNEIGLTDYSHMIEFAAARLVLAFHCFGRLNNSDMKRIVLQKKLKVNSIEPINKKNDKRAKNSTAFINSKRSYVGKENSFIWQFYLLWLAAYSIWKIRNFIKKV